MMTEEESLRDSMELLVGKDYVDCDDAPLSNGWARLAKQGIEIQTLGTWPHVIVLAKDGTWFIGPKEKEKP